MRGNLAAITLFDASPPNALRAPSEMSPRRRDGGLEVWRGGIVRPNSRCSHEKQGNQDRLNANNNGVLLVSITGVGEITLLQ